MAKLTPQTNVGLRWIGDDGKEYETFRDRAPVIYMSISTYCFRHFYTRIYAERPLIRTVGSDERLVYGGYGENSPNMNVYQLDAERTLEQYEADVGEKGFKTSRLLSRQQAFELGIKTILDNFEGDWVVRFNGCGRLLDETTYELRELGTDLTFDYED